MIGGPYVVLVNQPSSSSMAQPFATRHFERGPPYVFSVCFRVFRGQLLLSFPFRALSRLSRFHPNKKPRARGLELTCPLVPYFTIFPTARQSIS